MRINIVGAGMMGTAMAVPALDRGHDVRVIGTPLDNEIIAGLKENGYHITMKRMIGDGARYYRYDEIAEELNDCDILICGVSSFGVEWFASEILPKLESGKTVLAITKGLWRTESGDLIPFPIYFKSLRPDISFNAVGGPCTSYELADKVHTQVAFCGDDIETVKMLRDALTTDYYHVSATTDICGIEVAVALKNAYAMAVSLAIGLYTGNDPQRNEKYNAQAGLFYQAVKEMASLITRLGGKSQALAFGAGDLYVTVFGGRTRRLGTILGSGVTFSEAKKMLAGVTLESVAITKLIGAHICNEAANYPLMVHIYTLLTTDTVKEIPWDKMTFTY